MKKQFIAMIAVALITAVIVLVAVLVGMNLSGSRPATNADTESVAVAMAEPEVSAVAEVPKIAIPGYAQLFMSTGSLIQKVELHNPKENPCFFVISIILPDGTEVFRSGKIEPGQKTDAIKLLKTLDIGTYENTVLRYECYSITDNTKMNGADTKFILEVF